MGARKNGSVWLLPPIDKHVLARQSTAAPRWRQTATAQRWKQSAMDVKAVASGEARRLCEAQQGVEGARRHGAHSLAGVEGARRSTGGRGSWAGGRGEEEARWTGHEEKKRQ